LMAVYYDNRNYFCPTRVDAASEVWWSVPIFYMVPRPCYFA
jgi:hypothetical protein